MSYYLLSMLLLSLNEPQFVVLIGIPEEFTNVFVQVISTKWKIVPWYKFDKFVVLDYLHLAIIDLLFDSRPRWWLFL